MSYASKTVNPFGRPHRISANHPPRVAAASAIRRKPVSLPMVLALGLTFSILASHAGRAYDASEVATNAQTSICVFDGNQSSLVQTGGIAGVHRAYWLQGQFHLSVDPDAGTATFLRVDANAIDYSDFYSRLDPNEVFNMTTLTGALTASGAYVFQGRISDGSSVQLTLFFKDDSAHLNGQTTPPPGSADFFVFSIDAVARRKYGGGTGTAEDPYQIWTPEQISAIGTNHADWNQDFRLMADIDLAGATYKPYVIPEFTGVFDGNEHTVSHLVYPLFGRVGHHTGAQRGVVANLGLIDPLIQWASPSGALAGELYGTVHNCYVRGGRIGGSHRVGGLVGSCILWGSIISDCHADTTVSGYNQVGGLVGYVLTDDKIARCYATGTVTGREGVGGLAGVNRGTIVDSYARASVTGTSAVGGLAGENAADGYRNGRIMNCYSTGPVNGDTNVGGLIGYKAGDVANSFWDIEISGLAVRDGGTGKTTAEMQSAATFLEAGWDFANETANGTKDIWEIDEGRDYPRHTPRPGIPFGYGGGWGRPDNPYLIYTAEQLNAIGADPNDWGSHFKLMADIDLSQYKATDFNIIGTGYYYPGTPFRGVFDGNGHTISNFTYSSTGGTGIGIFGYVASPVPDPVYAAEIKNVGLIDPNVNVEGGSYVAALVGRLVGSFGGARVANCYVVGGTVAGDAIVGGLVGDCTCAVTHCYSTCAVSGQEDIGGLIGYNKGSLTNSYSTGAVNGNNKVGGLVGSCDWDRGMTTNSFWDIQALGQTTSAGGTGKTTAEMQMAGTFLEAGWDFVGETANGTDDIWWILEGQDYPRLWWKAVEE